MKPIPITLMAALAMGLAMALGTPVAAGAVTLRDEVPGPPLSTPAFLVPYEQTREEVYRVETHLQGFAIDPAASSVRHVREAPRHVLPGPTAPTEDSLTIHPLSGSILATVTEHHWEEHSHLLRNGEVEWTLVRKVHNESTLELDGLGVHGMPPGFTLPGFMSVFAGDRYRGPPDPCSSFGPGRTAFCSWTGTGPQAHYEAWLDTDILMVEGFVSVTDFLSPQGAEYYTFDLQATAVPVPAALWLLLGALPFLPWRRRYNTRGRGPYQGAGRPPGSGRFSRPLFIGRSRQIR